MTQTQKSLCPAFRLAGISLISSALLHAEDTQKDKTAEELPATVITATKTPTEVWKTAATVTVIDRAKIEQEQYRLLPDALRSVPGMAIADRGTPGSFTGVFVRGTETRHTAVLIDGRPMPANLAGGFNIETTPLDNVERIEVMRGPAATLYGGKTIGGVINIITRKGRGIEKPETTTYFEAGSYGSFREGISTLGSAGDVDWAFEGSRTDVQGQRVNSRLNSTSAAGRFGWQISEDLRFDLDTRYYLAEAGAPNSVAFEDPKARVQTEFWSISPRIVWDTTDIWQQTLTYSYSGFRQVAADQPFNGDNRATIHTQFIEYLSTVRALDNWTITAGLWLQDLGFTRYADDLGIRDVNQHETNWAVSLQSQLEILPDLVLTTGARYDSYSDFGSAMTYRQGVSYRVPHLKTLLHASYGTAFSPPSAQEREPALFGSADLDDPETSKSFEVGIEQPLLKGRLTVGATYFRNSLRNLYQFIPFAIPVPPFGSLEAVGNARTQGLEFHANWQPCEYLNLNSSYTYLDDENLDTGGRLIRKPRHQIQAGLTVTPVKDVTVSLSGLYMMDREEFGGVDAEDYCLVRLAANWKLSKNVEIFGRIENVLGDQYQEVLGFPAQDTGAYAGVKLRF